MTRYDNIKVLPYSSQVIEKNSLDAIEWCENHIGFGSYSFSWVFVIRKNDIEINTVVGEFGFSDIRDYVMFNTLWI